MKINIYKRIFLIIFVPLIFLFLTEFFLRVSIWNEKLGPQRFYGGLEDHSLFWNPNNIIRIPIDEYRLKNEFRGRKYSLKKLKGTIRIICLGGSFTYGWPYIHNPELSYPFVLEKLLNESKFLSSKYEVINAGVGGYTSYQGLFYFKYRLIKFNPDIVIVCFGANDSNNNLEIGSFLTDKEYYQRLLKLSKNKMLFRIYNFLNNLRIYALIEKIVFNIKKIFIRPKKRVPPSEFKSNLEEFIRLSKKYHFKLLLMLEPHRRLENFYQEVKNNLYCNIMYKLALKNKEVILIDTISLVKKYRDDEIFCDIMHFNSFGYKILARYIYDILLRKNLLR